MLRCMVGPNVPWLPLGGRRIGGPFLGPRRGRLKLQPFSGDISGIYHGNIMGYD